MEIFRELGLTKYESLVYETLLKIGISDAGNISRASLVPQTAVYPALKSLIEKQLIQEIKGKISLFESIQSDIAIRNFFEKKEKEFLSIREKAIKYALSLPKEGSKDKSNEKEVLSVTYGKDISSEIYFEAMKKTKKTFYILGWRFDQVDDKYNVLKHLKNLIKKKIDVRIILIGSNPAEKKADLIEDYQAEGIKIKYLPLNNFSIFIRDGEECKITLKDKTLPERFNIRVLDNSLASAMNQYFLTSWKNAQEIDNIKPKPL